MHVLQALKLDAFVSFCTDVVDEGLYVISQFSKTTVNIFLEELIFYLR